MSVNPGRKLTRRNFMIYRLYMKGSTIAECSMAVSLAAANHPEWDMEEERTWKDWNG